MFADFGGSIGELQIVVVSCSAVGKALGKSVGICEAVQGERVERK